MGSTNQTPLARFGVRWGTRPGELGSWWAGPTPRGETARGALPGVAVEQMLLVSRDLREQRERGRRERGRREREALSAAGRRAEGGGRGVRLPRPARPRAQTRPARAALCLVPPARPALARCPCRGGQLPRVRTRAWWWSSLGASANYSSGRPPGSRLPARLSLSSLGCCPHPCAVHVQASRVCVCVCVNPV